MKLISEYTLLVLVFLVANTMLQITQYTFLLFPFGWGGGVKNIDLIGDMLIKKNNIYIIRIADGGSSPLRSLP